MRAVGLDPERIPEAARDDIGTWIELHIEQGPVLEAAGRTDEAATLLRDAIDLYDRKGATHPAGEARRRLETLLG